MATTPGTITSFTTTPKSSLDIDGTGFTVETAGKSYSLTEADSQTMQFEIQPGDQAWFDGGSAVDRSEIQDHNMIATNTPVNINYQFMVQPGATNTASWFVVAEMHNDDPAAGSNVHTSPPFAVQLEGEKLQVVARYCPTGEDPSNAAGNVKMLTLWTDSTPIVRGQYYNIQIQSNVSNTSAGYLEVSINGVEVVNYHGPLGYGTPTYWEEGLYRSTASQTVTADYRNLSITTGSGAGTTTGTATGSTSGTGTTTGSSGGSTSSGGTTGTGSGSTTSGSGTTPPKVGTGASGGATPPKVTTGTGTVGTGASGGATPPKVTTSTGTVGTGASGGATPPKVPVLSVADHSLSVNPGHAVALGIGVTVPNKGDAVTVHVAGLPKYETITDNLDHKTFRGSSISLTAAEANSGLTLTSHYRGHGDPSATLSVTATDSTGKPVTSAAQTITVKDPSTAVASSGTSSGTTTKPVTSSTSSDDDDSSGHHGHHGHHFHDLAQWFSHHSDFAPVATTLSEAGASKSAATPKVGTATDSVASAGAKSFALLNQMMAGDFGRDSHFAQVATASTASLQQAATSLTKPLH